MTEKPTVPFSRDYVLRTTLHRMQLAVNVSTQKTIARFPEFSDDDAKKREIMTTLNDLGRLNTLIEQILEENKELIVNA